MIQLRQLDPILFECDQVPLSAGAPPFPLDDVQKGLTESFGLRGGELSLEPPVWRESGKGLIGLGADPILLSVQCTPLDAPLFWAMGPKELSKVMALFLDGKEAAAALEASLSQSFLNFLMAEVMELLERADYPSSSLTFTLSENSPLPDEPVLTIDVQWAAERRKVKGRLLIPLSFHRELQSYFANQRSIRPSKELLESLSIPVQWEVGETTLSFEEWQRVKPGDLLLLDRFDRDHPVVSAKGIPLATAVAEATGFRIEKLSIWQEELSDDGEWRRDHQGGGPSLPELDSGDDQGGDWGGSDERGEAFGDAAGESD